MNKKRLKLSRLELESLTSVLALQFSREVAEMFMDMGSLLEVEKSSSTGRIRHVYLRDKLIGTIRAQDGMFIPTIEGARIILKKLKYPKKRVVVTDDAAPFIATGKTLFCKHVKEVDPELRAGEEVFVVDSRDELLAVGKVALSADEIKTKDRGRAAKIRKGVKEL